MALTPKEIAEVVKLTERSAFSRLVIVFKVAVFAKTCCWTLHTDKKTTRSSERVSPLINSNLLQIARFSDQQLDEFANELSDVTFGSPEL